MGLGVNSRLLGYLTLLTTEVGSGRFFTSQTRFPNKTWWFSRFSNEYRDNWPRFSNECCVQRTRFPKELYGILHVFPMNN